MFTLKIAVAIIETEIVIIPGTPAGTARDHLSDLRLLQECSMPLPRHGKICGIHVGRIAQKNKSLAVLLDNPCPDMARFGRGARAYTKCYSRRIASGRWGAKLAHSPHSPGFPLAARSQPSSSPP